MKRLKPFVIPICVVFAVCIVLTALEIATAGPTAIELLVRTSDGPGGRRKGDIISMKQIPHVGWGKGEGPPNYVIVKIDNLKARDFAQYHVRHGKLYTSDTSEFPETVRSRFRFDLDNLPTAISGMITAQKTATEENLIDRRVEIISNR